MNNNNFKDTNIYRDNSITKSDFINYCTNMANNLDYQQNITIKLSPSYFLLTMNFYDLHSKKGIFIISNHLGFIDDLLQLLNAEIQLSISSNLTNIWLIEQITKN